MKIVIDIKTDNAAFEENQHEVHDILINVRNKIDCGDRTGICMDHNGNTVGKFKVTGK